MKENKQDSLFKNTEEAVELLKIIHVTSQVIGILEDDNMQQNCVYFAKKLKLIINQEK